VTRPWSGEVVLLLDGSVIWQEAASLSPGQPLQAAVPLADGAPQRGRLVLRLVSADGSVAAEYGAKLDLK
jgi:hypothetical protein